MYVYTLNGVGINTCVSVTDGLNMDNPVEVNPEEDKFDNEITVRMLTGFIISLYCGKNVDFRLKCADFDLKIFDFVLKMLNFAGISCDPERGQFSTFQNPDFLF